jgi:hypothetical protein
VGPLAPGPKELLALESEQEEGELSLKVPGSRPVDDA